jgi:putative endonuclease
MAAPHSYWVYVLWSATGECFYIGLTDDLARRLTQHNGGVSRWTRRYAGSWTLVWQKSFDTLSAARAYENLLKRQRRGHGFFQHTGLAPALYRRCLRGS